MADDCFYNTSISHRSSSWRLDPVCLCQTLAFLISEILVWVAINLEKGLWGTQGWQAEADSACDSSDHGKYLCLAIPKKEAAFSSSTVNHRKHKPIGFDNFNIHQVNLNLMYEHKNLGEH